MLACDVLDCNIYAGVVIEKEEIDNIMGELIDQGASGSDISIDSLISNLKMAMTTPQGDFHANYVPEFSSVEDSALLFIAELPGVPDTTLYYFWQYHYLHHELDTLSQGEGALLNSPEHSDNSCLVEWVDPETGPSGFHVRYWDPCRL